MCFLLKDLPFVIAFLISNLDKYLRLVNLNEASAVLTSIGVVTEAFDEPDSVDGALP